jgi:hypothetical protein
MNAPFGQTGTATPLMRSAASPVPTVPKMKLESRTVRSCSGFGYVTVICSGPRTSGTGGSFGFGEGITAGMSGTGGAGAGVGAAGRRGAAQDALAIAMQQEKTLMVEAFISRM